MPEMKTDGDDLDLRLSSAFDGIYEMAGGLPTFRMLIDGAWRESERDEAFAVRTPINGSSIARAQAGTKSDVQLACRSAKRSRGIREMPGWERMEIFRIAVQMLKEHQEEFLHSLQLEAGKTRSDAQGEFEATVRRLEFTRQEAGRFYGDWIPGDWNKGTEEKMSLVIREPLGVVAAIVPFNYPLFIAATKVVPALLAGNSVVVKPSSTNPISATMLTRILQMAGVPEGSLNLVTGKGSEAGDALVESNDVDMINFTGSTPVGKEIAGKAGFKRLHLELGGKAYAIVLEDANLDLAARRCVYGSLKFSGQRCDAVSAILAVEGIADELVERMVAEAEGWKLGDPRDGSVSIGPLIDSRAAERISDLVKDATEKGARLLLGGGHHDAYFEPTVLDHVPKEAAAAREEIFGPLAVVIRCKDEGDALGFALESRYGLESAVFTENLHSMWRVARALECGEVTVNDCPSHGVGYFPFGGKKDSGVGREGIGYSIDELTALKTIVFNLGPAGRE